MQIAGRAFDEPMVYRIAQAYCEAAGTCIGADVEDAAAAGGCNADGGAE